ncbi:SAM-dependent methyltransferase [Streptomyces sp. NPDC004296]|uniref:SAM-dependent methyltransferase n=1 Tax=Streptomyces sp. NPDC004296 TaxID=3364697 RepID=UPI0036A234CE
MAVPEDWMGAPPRQPVDLHTDRPHAARVYDVLLGGKTNYPADREAAEQTLAALPNAGAIARQNRAFMQRAARHLVSEAGIRQFLDIGTGIPTSPNLHEIVQATAPQARVVYADNDPIVLAHSRALHTSHPHGRTAYIQADLCRPGEILRNPALREVSDNFEAKGSHVNARSKGEVLRFFHGLDLVDPGLTVVHRWRPDTVEVGAAGWSDADIPLYAGLGRTS